MSPAPISVPRFVELFDLFVDGGRGRREGKNEMEGREGERRDFFCVQHAGLLEILVGKCLWCFMYGKMSVWCCLFCRVGYGWCLVRGVDRMNM